MVNAKLLKRLDLAGADLASARKDADKAKQAAQHLATEAIAAGMSERDIARRLGVDRMTVRNWLGKR